MWPKGSKTSEEAKKNRAFAPKKMLAAATAAMYWDAAVAPLQVWC